MARWVRPLALGSAIFMLPLAAFATDTNESTFIKNPRQLIYEGRRSGEGYFSPDGKKLIFQAERELDNPFYQIYIVDLETGDISRVSPGSGKTTCSFFKPNSDRVLFASTHDDPDAKKKQKEEFDFRESGKEKRYSWDYDEHFEIYEARANGKKLTRLTEAVGYDAEGSYSPDGKQIVFCSLRDAYPVDKLSDEDRERMDMDPSYFGEIYIMKADGSGVKRLTRQPGYDGGPFFTPDGQRIVWRHFTEDGAMADVYTMKTDGSDVRQLTDFGAMCWAPYFHPSGEYAIFTTNKQGFANFELYIVDRDGKKEPVRITYTDGFDGLPVFSPDGTMISWTSNRTGDGASQLFLANWNHASALSALDAAPARGQAPDEGASAEITETELRELVSYLASDELEGRMTGSDGEKKAREYIADKFSEIGLEPAGDDNTYFQKFPFVSGISVDEGNNELVVLGPDGASAAFVISEDFRPMGFSDNDDEEAEVVFAGYGLTAPGDEGEPYDSYSGLDVEGKFVLILRYVPEGIEMDRRAELNRYAGLRYKAMLARDNGAKGVIIGIGPNSPNAGELIPMGFDQSSASSGIPVVSVGKGVLDAMFAGRDKTLEEVQSELDIENPHFEGTFAMEGVKLRLKTKVRREMSDGYNVVGFLPPGKRHSDEHVVVVGAHFDHLGRGIPGSSLARDDEKDQIHNGADDNASGTAALVEIAHAMAHRRAKDPDAFPRGVVFAAWSGEEVGLIGSSFYAEHPFIELDRTDAYANFDMVGRLKDNNLLVQGVGSAESWKRTVEKRNVAAGFNIKMQTDPYLPTDVTAFYPKKVPVIAFFTGSHEDYHRPTDDTETIDFEGLTRIARFANAIIGDVIAADDAPVYAEVARSKEQTGSRSSLRAYLGTIPDYATGDLEGVKLSGVSGGGPADKAGILGGDIIVEFGGRAIKNIYDYTYALDAVKIGEPVEIVVLRNGERVTLTIIPEARN